MVLRKTKKLVSIILCAVFAVGTVAGCSCSNSTDDNTVVTGYKCDFTTKDIAIPQGTKLTDNGLEVTDKAEATVKNVLDVENQLPVIVARDGEEPSPELRYMKEVNEKTLRWRNYNAVSQYTADTANQISPTYGKVAGFGQNVFDVVRAYYTGDLGAAISGVSGVLNMFGLFGSASPGVSNEQILMEVQKVYSALQDVALDVKDIQGLLSVMSNQLDETTMQAYRNGLQPFDNAMIALDTDAEIINNMFITGAELLQQQGVNAPAENASDAEQHDYIGKLIATIEENEKTNPDLKNFDSIMNDLINNYTLVAGELGKTNEFSPLNAYDSYWNMYFNWESQGYALRYAYRANATFQLKRAYATIAMYYNIGTGNTATTYQKYGQLLDNALTQIEQNGPGISPQQVASAHEEVPFKSWEISEPRYKLNIPGGLYTSTFDKRLDAVWEVSGHVINDDVKNMASKMPKELFAKYAEKLHGKSLENELRLAGLWDQRMTEHGWQHRGFGANIIQKDKRVRVDLIAFNGEYLEAWAIESIRGQEGIASPISVTKRGDDWYEYTTTYMFHLQ